jgi:hypothetical protein
MRTDLKLLEKIDLYSSGKLTGEELSDFEQAISSDEALRGQVEAHIDLLRAVRRKALRNQISIVSAAGGASGYSNFTIGASTVLGITAIVLTTLFLNGTLSGTAAADDALVGMNEPEIQARSNETDQEKPLVENYKKYEEEPETIFSSQKHYDDHTQLNDDMNVTVRFKSGGEGVKVDQNIYVTTANDLDQNDKVAGAEKVVGSDEFNGRKFTRKASYPGGNGAMKKFIDKNLRYPRSALDKSIQCVVRCEFHVTEDGLISEINAECIKMSDKDGVAYNDVKLLMNRRIMNAFIENATHILRTMPTWEPEKNAQGNPILSVQRMYFNYDLERGCLVYQLEEN